MFWKRYRLFDMFGFKVNVDASWIVIAVLIVWMLSAAFFPAQYPNLSIGIYVAMGIFAAFLFFGSIIIHEFCHSLVARYYGMPMKGITLWIFGGVAEMSDEPPSAKAEFAMAAAGPLASLVIAGVFYGLTSIAEAGNWPVFISGVFAYLWRINLILVIFNILPAFPLDGGRILRSLLWGAKGEIRWATRIASRIGSGFGAVMMILGVLSLLMGNPLGGIWYFLIGMFIRFAARASYSQLLIKGSLKDVSLRKFITREPIVVTKGESLGSLVENYFFRYYHRLFPVVGDQGILRGCVVIDNVQKVPREAWNTLTVGDVMQECTNQTITDPDSDPLEALKKLNSNKIGRIILVEDGRPIGIVSLSDMMRFISLHLELSSETGDMDSPKLKNLSLNLSQSR